MKKKRNKLFLLEIICLFIMGMSGIYATTSQISNSQLNTAGVDISLQILKINSQNEEVEFVDSNYPYMPAEYVSFIPKIKNHGENCYIRVSINFLDLDIDVAPYINISSDNWLKKGNYYYYNGVLKSDETIKIFDQVQIPQDLDESFSGQTLKFEIVVEAIQEKNFEPDYAKLDPWNGIIPTQSINSKYDLDSNILNFTIEFENGANEDITIPSDFLSGLLNLMPGDTYSSDIVITNTNKNEAKYYLKINLDSNNSKYAELLKMLNLVVKNGKGDVVYDGEFKVDEKLLLGQYNIGEQDLLNFKVNVPKNLSNEYSYLKPKLNWVFSVNYNNVSGNVSGAKLNFLTPKTGDGIDIYVTLFVISAICLVIVMVIDYKERKK